MKAETTRFGTIDVKEQSIIRMEEGMLGFEQCKSFVLLEEVQDAAFKWLQCLDDPSVAFVVINPIEFFPSYEIDLPDEQALSLGINDASEAAILTTVNIRSDLGKVTTNLVGPIVMNTRTLMARQVVLSDDRYHTMHAIGETVVAQTDSRELAKAA